MALVLKPGDFVRHKGLPHSSFIVLGPSLTKLLDLKYGVSEDVEYVRCLSVDTGSSTKLQRSMLTHCERLKCGKPIKVVAAATESAAAVAHTEVGPTGVPLDPDGTVPIPVLTGNLTPSNAAICWHKSLEWGCERHKGHSGYHAAWKNAEPKRDKVTKPLPDGVWDEDGKVWKNPFGEADEAF